MRLRLLASLLVVSCGSAWAAPTPRSALPAAANDVQTEALALFRESLVRYRAGQFRDAADLLQRAYALRPKPILLYNLGRAFEGMGALEQAVTAYRGYLEGEASAPDAMAIQVRIETLTQLIDERSRLERERKAAIERAEAESARRRANDRNRKPSPAPWSIAGVGVIGLVTGAALGGVAHAQNDAAASASTQAEGQVQLDRAHRIALGANVSLGVGAALAVAGGIWGLVDLVRLRRARARGLSAQASDGSAGWRF